jgi:hypothetical protein
MSGQKYQFTLFDGEVDAGQGFVAAGVALGDLAELDHALTRINR